MPAILQVQNLHKVFRPAGRLARPGFVAVEDVSFSLSQGGCLAIVGESGSGKTTIARIVAGLESATSGSVLLDGESRPPIPWPRRDRMRLAGQVQMVFQDPNSSLDPSQTLEQSLGEILRLHFPGDQAWRRERISELLAHVGLDERHRSVRPRRLSGGERQRAAIARALAVQPRLLILDESVSALDVSVQAHVLNLLADLRAQLGLTYLFISHDLAVVRQVSDDCIVMQGGQVLETGRTVEVLANPRADYTRQLLDAVPRPGWRPQRRPSVVADPSDPANR
jgi:oligopeptide transport system ATP-binding protein